MDDSPIAGLIASLRAAVEIVKELRDLSDPSLIQSKVSELKKVIMTAQSCALATQSAQFDLLVNQRDLEEEMAKLKAWNTEKYRYELQSVGPGAVAYVLKESMRGSEPIHWLCANCFQSGRKSFLNESHSDLHHNYYKCQECGGKIRIKKAPSPPGQAIVITDYDPFAI
jgi:DNA-directed RNA polymerase subunit RPC12/RpoP